MRIKSMGIALCAVGVLACNDSDPAPVEQPPVEQPRESIGGKADSAFSDGPLYLTGGFDGSKSFKMWYHTLKFARDFEGQYDVHLGWTYFINTCYYDDTVDNSWIGTAKGRDEILARWGITQQTINEGHEIANHSVRHQDGSSWSYEQWEKETQEFHRLVERNLFEPIYDEEGVAVFPKYVAAEVSETVAEGAMNTKCVTDDDCSSGPCLAITATHSVCSAKCNKNRPCANGMACGAPDWNRSTDLCLPIPSFPVEHNGEILFDEEGNANLEHPELQNYQVIGFRAPQLAHNANLFKVLTEFGYRYDTSKILRPGPPEKTVHRGELFDQIYQFALMKNPGSRTIPMDYNYKVNDGSGERMLKDYKQSIIDAYNDRERQPWNIGHHFALWRRGAYWEAMKDAFVFAAEGCLNDAGEKQCESVLFPTFLELADVLDGKIDAERVRLGNKADGVSEDIFVSGGGNELENDSETFCVCDEEEHH